jgi:hypothetical protein
VTFAGSHIPQGHRLEVGSYGIHPSLIGGHATIPNERSFCVVEVGLSIAVGVVSNLCKLLSIRSGTGESSRLTMIIPDGDPGELLMAQRKVKVCPVASIPHAVVGVGSIGSERC